MTVVLLVMLHPRVSMHTPCITKCHFYSQPRISLLWRVSVPFKWIRDIWPTPIWPTDIWSTDTWLTDIWPISAWGTFGQQTILAKFLFAFLPHFCNVSIRNCPLDTGYSVIELNKTVIEMRHFAGWPNVPPCTYWPNVRWPSVRWPNVRWPSVRWPNGRCPSVWIPFWIRHLSCIFEVLFF